MAETKRQQFEILRAQLENERSSFLPHWRDLGDFILPRRPRFTVTDVNRGDRRNQKIIDSTATLAARTLRSGMMAGVTSPARPWFRLSMPDPHLAEFGPVKEWLHVVSQRMATIFLRSNLYNALPVIYGDIGVFATSAMAIEEDFQEGIRAYAFPVGSYMIANNDRLKVDVFMREFRMTVRQLVQRFGERDPRTGKPIWDNFSTHVRNLWDQGHYEAWIDVVHVIKPNEEYNPDRLNAKFKKYTSCYYERGSLGPNQGNYMGGEDKYLKESGYDYFPILCPRWEVTGEDVYGTECPGMAALGDIKQLQHGERRSAQAIDKMVNPPMVGPPELRTQKASIIAGDITYLSERDGQKGFRPAHEINPRIQELEGKQDQVRNRIQRAFYEDLFLMLANSDRRQITAREIEERHEEKLLALGPVLEQLNQDLLDPLIDVTFDMMQRQGMIPEPPDEIQEMDLKVEYISIMAQAQKLVGLAGIERFAGFAGQIIAASPEAADKVDTDQILDVYGDLTSVPPGVVRSDEQVAEMRAQRAEAQQRQQQAEMLPAAAGTAKTLSETDVSGDNALTRMIQQAQAGQLTQG